MDKIKAIFFDFDWTLFDHQIRDFNKLGVEAINKAHEKGIKLIINSARSYYSLKGLHTFEKIKFDGFVTSNGGSCILGSKTLYADFYKKEVSDKVLKFLNEHNLSYNLICQFNTFIKVTDEKIVKDFYSVFYEPFPLDIKEYKDEEILAFQVFITEENDAELKELINSLKLRYDRFAENNVEISPIEFLKSKGIETIFNHLNIKKEEGMAFGDDLNDISMFKIVKYGICMGNGKDEAKKEAFYVTDRIEENGIYNALKKFEII